MRSTHANREMLPGIGAAVLLAFTGSGATAADWRYCYAAVSAQHRFYVSMPFPASPKQEMTGIETAFREALARQQINVDNAACPRGSDQSAVSYAGDWVTGRSGGA